LESSIKDSKSLLTNLNDVSKLLKNYKKVKSDLNTYLMFINDVLKAYQQMSANQVTL
jgi:flagellar hook-basal body complex protein FliE